MKNVEERTSEQFESGEVAWELSKGTNGGDWGQVLDRGEDNPDRHPHFLTQPDKEDESEVYRVTFKANNPKIDLTYFVDPGADVVLPEDTPENTKWYVKGKEFDGTNIRADMDAVAVRRFLFAGETEPIEATGTYSTEAQTLELNLDEHMGYENGGPSAVGRFEYIIAGDKDGLNAQLDIDGNILTIPPKTNVKDDGYTLTVKAHEKKPFIATLSLGPFDKEDVYLTVKVMINKATPVIVAKPTASTIDYGMNLASSTLAEDGEAQHPTTGANVEGKFEWTDGGIYPTIDKAAIVGYSVTFTPRDTNNYNTATTLVTLTVNKVDPTNIVPPTPNDITYNGNAQDLITAGSAIGGTMKYWITDDSNDNPPEDNFAFSSTIPARANAGTYIVWYKVLGDENHNDTVPKSIEITIKPYKLNIEPGPVFYNGSGVYALTLDGAGGEIVVATLTAYSKDAKTYEYATTAAEGKYTVKLSSPNYVVEQTETLTITPLPVVLQWEGPLTIEYDGQTHTVTAKVTNGIAGDTFNLVYEDNTGTAAKKYTAKVTQLGNSNYTLIGGQNVEQPWRIFERSGNLNLTANPAGTKEVPITYGDMLTLTLKISPVTDINGKVKFYINDKLINGDVSYDDYANYNNKIATITVEATSLHDFSLGANAVRADYVSGNDNNNVIDIDAITVYVNPKPITAVITGDTTSKTYDGNTAATGLGITLQTSDIEVGDEDYVTVTADGYTYNSNYVSKATTITAQNVMLNGTRSGNYKITTPVALHGNIMPKAVRLEWRGATGLVYTGTPANVNATATELVPGDVCTVEVTGGDKSNAGINYTAEAKGLDNPNYRLSEFDKTQVYSIAPATLYIPEQHVTYNGTGKFNVEVDGVTLTNDTSEKVSTKLTASSADVGNYDYAKTIGDSKYTASTDNSNYQIASGAMLIIEKADPDYTAPVGKKLKYNAMPQELTTVGMAHGGEMQYSISKDGTYSTDIPTGTKKGTYTIWYRVIGDTNHNDIAPQSVVATITLNDPNTPTVSATPVNSSKPGDPVDSTDPDDPIVSTKPNALRESPKPDDTTKKPSSTQKSNDVPETRDETNITFWIVLMLLSLSGIIITLFAKKKIK
ncbi:MAG: hypothetical protein J1E62_08035 [Lachnospiraceae bacterium]|nr:hypothetical protein [Lachnospiraceae bacterium]